jgi:hypothetical protein
LPGHSKALKAHVQGSTNVVVNAMPPRFGGNPHKTNCGSCINA